MEPIIMSKIQDLFKKKPNIVYDIPHSIQNYKDVVKIFYNYRLTNKLDFYDPGSIITEVCKFHENNSDHIIMYHSSDKDDALLLCRIQEKNVNILIPSELGENKNKNIIAIYA